MSKVRDKVHITMHKDYFNKIFEPQRRMIGMRVGMPNISQVKFTQYLAKTQSPKLDLSLFPKRKPRFKL